jgi:hypothetical protein
VKKCLFITILSLFSLKSVIKADQTPTENPIHTVVNQIITDKALDVGADLTDIIVKVLNSNMLIMTDFTLYNELHSNFSSNNPTVQSLNKLLATINDSQAQIGQQCSWFTDLQSLLLLPVIGYNVCRNTGCDSWFVDGTNNPTQYNLMNLFCSTLASCSQTDALQISSSVINNYINNNSTTDYNEIFKTVKIALLGKDLKMVKDIFSNKFTEALILSYVNNTDLDLSKIASNITSNNTLACELQTAISEYFNNLGEINAANETLIDIITKDLIPIYKEGTPGNIFSSQGGSCSPNYIIEKTKFDNYSDQFKKYILPALNKLEIGCAFNYDSIIEDSIKKAKIFKTILNNAQGISMCLDTINVGDCPYPSFGACFYGTVEYNLGDGCLNHSVTVQQDANGKLTVS